MGSVLVSALTVTGASMCFLLSSSFGSTLRAMPAVSKHIDVLEKKVVAAKASGTLFYFLLSARVVPFTPNWALNIASPWVRRLPTVRVAPSLPCVGVTNLDCCACSSAYLGIFSLPASYWDCSRTTSSACARARC
jgi:hypothetical protein